MLVRKLGGLTAVLAMILLVGCSTTPPPAPHGQTDPDAAVARLHADWLAAPSDCRYAGAPDGNGKKTKSRAFIRRQAQNLAFKHPDHAPTRMLLGAMAYEANDPNDAMRHLDYLLRLTPANPEAAILRARIDLEAGNHLHALQTLLPQVRLRPDHAGLREALASAYFMAEEYGHASSSLDAAAALGGSEGRIAYNRGLIAEEQGNVDSAKRFYELALEKIPGWPRPQERLAGLGSDVYADPAAATPPAPPMIEEPALPAAALAP